MTVAAAVRALNCPNCGGAIEMRAAGYTVSLICPHCGSTLDATDPDVPLIERAAAAMAKPEIALGTRGILDGVEWEAVGYMERASEDGEWREYLLFNPYRGYRFLVDSDGRFSIGELLDRAPDDPNAQSVTIDGATYSASEEYEARVTFVVGEFYWRVRVGETVQVREYSAWGATSLSTEANGSERTWTRMRQFGRGEAEAAFGLPSRAAAFASPSGSADWERLKQALRVALYAIGALMLLSAFGCVSRPVLLDREIALDLDAAGRTFVLGPIELAAARSALTVRAETSGLDNAWVDLDYSLVDRRTQASYDASGAAEYYHGRDSDGDWSEGERRPETRFAGIPTGTYDLVVEAAAHSWAGGSSATTGSSFTFDLDLNGRSYSYGAPAAAPPRPKIAARIQVLRGAFFAEHFWLALVLILLWPAILVWRLIRRRSASSTNDDDED